MTAHAPNATAPAELAPRNGTVALTLATVRVFLLRFASNPILLIRAPLTPVLILIGYHLTYDVSGQHQIGNQSAMGFLVIGMLGTGAWSSTVWGAGNAIQTEVYEGTISSVIAAPGRISAVITGQGLGSIVFGLPALAACVAVGLGFGASFDIASPSAAIISLVAVYLCCLCIGLAFGGLFILTRQSNAMSNFLQAPVYLLAGFIVPRSALPDVLQKLSDLLPIAHAITALRDAALDGASLADVGSELLATAATSVLFLLAGLWGLHRMDDAVRRRGTLDLM